MGRSFARFRTESTRELAQNATTRRKAIKVLLRAAYRAGTRRREHAGSLQNPKVIGDAGERLISSRLRLERFARAESIVSELGDEFQAQRMREDTKRLHEGLGWEGFRAALRQLTTSTTGTMSTKRTLQALVDNHQWDYRLQRLRPDAARPAPPPGRLHDDRFLAARYAFGIAYEPGR